MSNLIPEKIVNNLDKYIIGQKKAKKIIAIALRNRWRRLKLKNINKNEIKPKNILIVGPTGVGKTEIARRISEISDSPFIKVEATKFTEVGYVGKDVDSIIKDLADISFKIIKSKLIKKNKILAKKKAEEKLIDLLIILEYDKNLINDKLTRDKIKLQLKKGLFDNKDIEIDLSSSSLSTPQLGIEIISPYNSEDIISQLQTIFRNFSNSKNKIYKTKLKDAKNLIIEDELNKLLNVEELKIESIKLIEENGIVFIDEIDKICKSRNDLLNNDISNEGVQRDLLSLTDGCIVNTKYGTIKTDYILFIASGSFYNSKPSDLIPEFQGRFPIRINMDLLTKNDFKSILIKKKNSLVKNYTLLLSVDKIKIEFLDSAIDIIAEIAYKENEEKENLGARRLNILIEEIIEDISFNVSIYRNKRIFIDKEYILKNLNIKQTNINKYIL